MSNIEVKQTFIHQVHGEEVTWNTITMNHRGRDYYLQFFPGSPLAYLIRPSESLTRNSVGLAPLKVTVLRTKTFRPGTSIDDHKAAFEFYYRRLGYTDIQYVPPFPRRHHWVLVSHFAIKTEDVHIEWNSNEFPDSLTDQDIFTPVALSESSLVGLENVWCIYRDYIYTFTRTSKGLYDA